MLGDPPCKEPDGAANHSCHFLLESDLKLLPQLPRNLGTIPRTNELNAKSDKECNERKRRSAGEEHRTRLLSHPKTSCKIVSDGEYEPQHCAYGNGGVLWGVFLPLSAFCAARDGQKNRRTRCTESGPASAARIRATQPLYMSIWMPIVGGQRHMP